MMGPVLGLTLLFNRPRPHKYFKYYFSGRRKQLNIRDVGRPIRSRAISDHTQLENQPRVTDFTDAAPYRVLFFGTDDFSVESLKILSNAMKNTSPRLISQLDVVTCFKSKTNSVQTFASQENLTLYNWPPDVNCGEYDMGLVVSFGHLIPEKIIKSFRLGMLNVHASLLPKYRGAAPIIYAILNGDTETGVTIMQIKPKRFDVGNIVGQARLCISPSETMPNLSTRLAKLGAQLLLDSIIDLSRCLQAATIQPEEGVSYAPRVTSAMSRVDWTSMTSRQVYNLARALDGLYPVSTQWHGQPVKLLGASMVANDAPITQRQPGYVELHRATKTLRVLCNDMHWVTFDAVRLQGKKPMKPLDFYNGYISKHEECDWRFR